MTIEINTRNAYTQVLTIVLNGVKTEFSMSYTKQQDLFYQILALFEKKEIASYLLGRLIMFNRKNDDSEEIDDFATDELDFRYNND